MADCRLVRTLAGRRIDVERRIGAPPDRAWDLLVDTRRWPDWGPSVTAVDCPDRRIEAGSRGRIRLPLGAWLPFAVTAFDPDRRRWRWRVARVPATGHRVDALGGGPEGGGPGDRDGVGDDACRVAFELPPAAVGYAPVCRRALGRIAAILES